MLESFSTLTSKLVAFFGGLFGLLIFIGTAYHNNKVRKLLRKIEENTRGSKRNN